MDALDKRKRYEFLAPLEREARGQTTEQVERCLRSAIVALDFAPGEFIDKAAVSTPDASYFDDMLSRPTLSAVLAKAALGPRSH